MDVKKLTQEVLLKNMTPEQQAAVLESVTASVKEAKAIQKQKIAENVDLVLQALKRIEADMLDRVESSAQTVENRVNNIKDGKDGINGRDGKDGKDGRPGRDGKDGKDGRDGLQGLPGADGQDGVGVSDAHIDFDGSLIITLTSGVVINVGEVVAPDLAESIKVISNGGGTSQFVLDTLTSLQNQIDTLIPSQTGNSGKFLTTNGSTLAWAQVAGGLSYQGTWNASTNTPTLASGTGSNGYYYIVGTAGSTNLDGITDWQIGDWLLFNGTSWQKIDQTNTVTSVNGQTGAVVLSTTNISEGTNLYYTDARASAAAPVQSVAGRTGAVTLTNADVGLSNVENKSSATIRSELTSSNVTIALGYTPYDATNPSGYTSNTGTVTSVSGTGTVSGLSLSGTVTTSGSLSLGGTLAVTPSNFASQTANTVLAAPNGTSGTPTFRALVAADIPTLNQNTTGTASNVTGTVAIANGGTGATTAGAALTNLGAYPASNPSGYTNNTGTVTSVTAGTGLAGGTITTTGTVSLATSGVTANTYGSSTAIPVITVDAYGRATTITTAAVAGGASISNDTATASTLYPLFAAATSGTPSTIYTSNAKYLYKPSTGELTASAHVSSNGITVNSQTIATSYTIASGNSAVSAGPVTISSGVTVTVSSGSRWVVV